MVHASNKSASECSAAASICSALRRLGRSCAASRVVARPCVAVTQSRKGALQGDQSALAFQLLDVYKIPCEGSGKLLKIVEGGSSQNSSPSVML